jgi:hypothetical protein
VQHDLVALDAERRALEDPASAFAIANTGPSFTPPDLAIVSFQVGPAVSSPGGLAGRSLFFSVVS